MKKIFQKTIATLTMVSFSFFSVVPANAKQVLDTSQIAKAVENYNNAPKDKGSAAFIEAFVPTLQKQDKEQLRKLMVGSGPYPELKLLAPNKIQMKEKGKTFLVEFKQANDGVLININSKQVKFDLGNTIEQNYRAIEKVLDAKEISFLNWLVPEANAMSTAWIVGLAVVGVALLGVAAYHAGKEGVSVEAHAPLTIESGK